ncbi:MULTISPECIES: DUF7539 family protein [Haloarcula]|uniref:DUF7539 family protein n=1 Tax=Haloarcula TaxID=2237 RepID=UPI0023ECAD53|nr:hypothetical protein [Halomicroarcula sp. XH51]
MEEIHNERQVVRRAQSHLDEWTRRARRQAYAELFDGPDPVLTEAERQLLDALDSELERAGGDGVWGTDQYGIHTGAPSNSTSPLSVVCVYHPQITSDSVLSGHDDLDDETEERLNDALWRYSEHVAALVQDQLEEFVDRTQR